MTNIILMLAPQRIIMGGGVMDQAHLFPLIRSEVQCLLNGYIQRPQVQEQIDQFIVPPGLGNRAGIFDGHWKRQRLSAQMPRTAFDRLMSCALSMLKISARPNSPGLICCGGVFGTQERLEHQRNRPAHDGHVGNVEGRPVPIPEMKIQKIRYGTAP